MLWWFGSNGWAWRIDHIEGGPDIAMRDCVGQHRRSQLALMELNTEVEVLVRDSSGKPTNHPSNICWGKRRFTAEGNSTAHWAIFSALEAVGT